VTPEIVASDGTRITRKTTKGTISVTQPRAMYDSLATKLPIDVLARTVDYSKTKTIDAIAEVMKCPKSGKGEITAEKVWDAEFMPMCEQGTRRVLVFG
jgi:hypothetical protein